MIEPIATWNVGCASPAERAVDVARLRDASERLRRLVPGLARREAAA